MHNLPALSNTYASHISRPLSISSLGKVHQSCKQVFYLHLWGGDIGHKDTLLILPPFYPHSALSWGFTTGLRYDPQNQDIHLNMWILQESKEDPCFMSLKDMDIGSYKSEFTLNHYMSDIFGNWCNPNIHLLSPGQDCTTLWDYLKGLSPAQVHHVEYGMFST